MSAESKSRLLVTYLSLRKVPMFGLVLSITCYCAWPCKNRVMEAHSQTSSLLPRVPGQMLIGGFCVGKRAVSSAISTVHPSQPLEGFLFRFSGPGERGVRVAWDAVHVGGGRSARQGLSPTSSYPKKRLIRDPYLAGERSEIWHRGAEPEEERDTKTWHFVN